MEAGAGSGGQEIGQASQQQQEAQNHNLALAWLDFCVWI